MSSALGEILRLIPMVAMYHVMSRGNRRQDIFLDDVGCAAFSQDVGQGVPEDRLAGAFFLYRLFSGKVKNRFQGLAIISLAFATAPDHTSVMDSSPGADDRYNLNRFVQAQQEVYPRALSEIKRGQKRSHWMWFIFPQIDGLGYSSTAKFYAIKSKDEAKAYLDHPLLGKRLIECAEVLLRIQGKSAAEIFGYPDDLKLHSSMTLFASVSPADSVFSRVLDQYSGGEPDKRTLELLQQIAPI